MLWLLLKAAGPYFHIFDSSSRLLKSMVEGVVIFCYATGGVFDRATNDKHLRVAKV
jgi:hypothetical protein